MEKTFKRRKEDFVCRKCGFVVKGDGFTDHCPKCLFSIHFDVNPGDRKSECYGLMEPIGVKKEGERYVIYYECLSCGYKHRVKKAEDDDFEEVIKISKKVF
jgi:rubrerythrin